MDKKSYKNIDIYYIGDIIIKNASYTKINGANPLCFIIDEANGYIKGNNENKYLTTEIWKKIKNPIETINGKPGDYDEKYENQI